MSDQLVYLKNTKITEITECSVEGEKLQNYYNIHT